MRTVKTLKPGQKGTKELLTRFGPSLLYVRYRYDEDSREHVKTVELVVQRRSRECEAECLGSRTPGARTPGARRPRSKALGFAFPRAPLDDQLHGLHVLATVFVVAISDIQETRSETLQQFLRPVLARLQRLHGAHTFPQV